MKKKLIILCCLFLMSHINIQSEGKKEEQGILFSIQTLPAKGQDPEIKSYYEFDVSKGLKTQIGIKVVNHSNQSLQIGMDVFQAITNSYGNIQYNKPFDQKHFDQLKHKITDYIDVKTKEQTLPANSSKIFLVDLSVPQNQIEGTVLGGAILL